MAQTPLVPRVHRQEHVQRLSPAHLSDDDARWSHPEGVAHQVTDADFAGTLNVARPGLQGDAVWQDVLQGQLGRLLHGDEALLGGGDGGPKAVHKCRLPAPGRTADDDVRPRLDGGLQKAGRLLREGAEGDELLQ